MNGRHFSMRLAWFVALWVMGVALTGLVAMIIKFWLGA